MTNLCILLSKEFAQASSATTGLTAYSLRDKPQPKKKKQLTSRVPLLLYPVNKAQIDEAAHGAATSPFNLKRPPTSAQMDAGNYPKGHLRISGIDISIENPQFSARHGRDWTQEMTAHYGYIRGATGADGDHVDVFVRAGTDDSYTGPVFVINQVDPEGNWDEHKVLIGWATQSAATRAYENNYQLGWKGMESIVELTWEAFIAWLTEGDHKSPLSKAPLTQVLVPTLFQLRNILRPVE